MGFSGNMSGLGQLERNIGRLASVPSRVAGPASASIASLIQHQFDTGTDPYGRPWAPLRPATLRRGRHAPPLTDTGKMRHGITVAPAQGAGIAVSFADPVPAGFHQEGTTKMVARKILPEGTLPATWNAAIATAASGAVRAAVGGK